MEVVTYKGAESTCKIPGSGVLKVLRYEVCKSIWWRIEDDLRISGIDDYTENIKEIMRVPFDFYKDCDINGLEHFLKCKANVEGDNYDVIKWLEEFSEDIMDVAREKFEEDLGLTSENPSVLDDLAFTVSLNELSF